MPEGPEVALFAKSLNDTISGTKLISLNIDSNSKYRNGMNNYDELNELLPLDIKKVWSKGKKIIFTLSNDVSFISSLGLEGKWTFDNTIKHGNLYLQILDKNGMKQKCYYCDSRHFGLFDIFISKQKLDNALNKIGPDLLTDNITQKQWMSVVTDARTKNMQVCDFMLKQEYFSGIGNYVRAEALYRAKIRPDARLHELTISQHSEIRKASIDIIRESYENGGASLKTYHDMNGEKGEFKVIIYGRKNDPDGNIIIKSIFEDGRDIYWVPTIQIYPSEYVYEPLIIDFAKLENSDGRGKNKYTIPELKAFARDKKISTTGNKTDLINRLMRLQTD